MIYVYDILLNFNDGIPYEFFEWNEQDTIDHIKRAPLYKVNRMTLADLLYGEVEVSKDFLTEIEGKTELYDHGMIQKLPFVALFTDGTLAIAVEFSAQGKSIYKSRMLLDEEEEMLEFAYDLKEASLAYRVLSKEVLHLETRMERQIKHFLKQEFQRAIAENQQEKIQYFYEECFEETIKKQDNAGEKILASLEELTMPHKKLYLLLKNSYQLKK